MKLIRAACDNPLSVVMLSIGVVVLGVLAALGLPVLELPEIEAAGLRVITRIEGLAPREVEDLITVPMENALASLPGLRELSASSKRGLSVVRIELSWGASLDRALLEARRIASATYASLPRSASPPVVTSQPAGARPALLIAVTPKSASESAELGRVIRNDIAAAYRAAPGVGAVRVIAAPIPELHVVVNAESARSVGLPLGQIPSLVSQAVFDVPVGTLNEGSRERLVSARGAGEPAAIAALPLGRGKLSLADIAVTGPGVKPPTSLFVRDGAAAAAIEIYPAGDTLTAVRRARAATESLIQRFGSQLNIEIIQDAGIALTRSIRGIAVAVAIGVLAVVGIMAGVTRTAAAALAALSGIPCALALAMLTMHMFGLSINVVSLTGLAVGLGMVVDNAVVVVDRIRLRDSKDAAGAAGAVTEVASATWASTLTTLLVFVPVVFVPGRLGALFAELAAAISALLLASFVSAVTLTPAVYLLMSPKGRDAPAVRAPSGRILAGIDRRVLRLTARVLERRRGMRLLLLTLLPLLAVLVWSAGVEIVPAAPSDFVRGELVLDAGVSLDAARGVAEELTARLADHPTVRTAVAAAGYEADDPVDRARGANGWNRLYFRVYAPRGARVDEAALLRDLVSTTLAAHPGLWWVGPPEDAVGRVLGVSRRTIVELPAANRDEAQLLYRSTSLPPGYSWVFGPGAVSEQLRIDHLLAARAGVAIQGIVQSLRVVTDGVIAARLAEFDMDLRILARETSLTELAVPGADGLVQISSIAGIETERGPAELERRARRPVLRVEAPANAPEDYPELRRATGSPVIDPMAAVRASQMRELLLVFGTSLLLSFIVLGAQSGSLLRPLVLLISFPLGAFGSFLVLVPAGITFNLYSAIGTLVTLGTVINAAILVTADFGSAPRELTRRVLLRAKTSAVTVATTVSTLLPIVLSGSPSAVIQRQTALPVIGGLIIGTGLVLVFIPAFAPKARE